MKKTGEMGSKYGNMTLFSKIGLQKTLEYDPEC